MENNQPNIELLNDVYQDTKMGEESIQNILPSVEDKELLEHFQAQMSGYSEYANKARELLAKQQELPKENGMMEKMMVGMSTKVNTLIDKTPSHLANTGNKFVPRVFYPSATSFSLLNSPAHSNPFLAIITAIISLMTAAAAIVP